MRSNASPEDAVAVVAACSMEAAWITLLYVTVESLAAGEPGPLPIIAFAAATFVGLAFARWSARHRQFSYRTLLAGILVATAIGGWLLPLGLAGGRLLDEPMIVVGMHPGGILVGLALLRGTAHVTPEDDERIADVALGPGLGLLAATWVLLTATGGTREPAIAGAAFAATVTYVTAGLLSMGLARMSGLRSAGVVGAHRHTWVGLLIGVVAVLCAVTIPLALIVGVPLDSAFRGALGPIGDILIPVVMLLALPAGLLATALVLLIESLRGNVTTVTSIPGASGGLGDFIQGSPLRPSGVGAVILGFVPLVIAIVAAFLIARRLLRRPRLAVVEGDITEIRESERPIAGVRLHRPHLPVPRRQLDPRNASEAYLASLDILAQQGASARLGWETPAEHARRLRADPAGPLLGRLAADYALEEFGQRTLAPSEHRRAIERWRRLRSSHGR